MCTINKIEINEANNGNIWYCNIIYLKYKGMGLMKIRHLQTFITIVELEGFTKAAEHLRYVDMTCLGEITLVFNTCSYIGWLDTFSGRSTRNERNQYI